MNYRFKVLPFLTAFGTRDRHREDGKELVSEVLVGNEMSPVRTAIIRKIEVNKCWDVEKMEPLCTVGGNAKWCSQYGKCHGGFSKN